MIKAVLPAFVVKIVRQFLRRLNAERFGVEKFLQVASTKIKPADRLLDAGSGPTNYRRFFSHARYESTDIEQGVGECHAFISELHSMPVRENAYDAIVCTQVLEHVEYPQQVVSEFSRILKSDGQVFLTAPQSWGVHMAPYHFYNFTRFGLESLFKNAHLEVLSITPIGGIFWNLAKIISKLPRSIMDGHRSGNNTGMILVLYPFYIVLKPLCEYLVPFVFFYLDRIDVNRNWTIGYACHCKKGAAGVCADSNKST
jgi:SAM-dependent methyltransferase